MRRGSAWCRFSRIECKRRGSGRPGETFLVQEMFQPHAEPERNGNGGRRRRLPSRRWSLADGAPSWVDGRDDEVNVGLVGLGYWGPNILRVLTEQPNVNVRWICDRVPERLERMSRRYPSVIPTERYDDLLEDPELDAVLIATPVFTHFELAEAALAAGKHTFVEKPLAASAIEAERARRRSAASAGLVLMCGHTFIYSPPVRAVKGLLDGGELGDIYFISSSRVNLGLHQPDVSVIWDLGPHDFSILRYWLERDARVGRGDRAATRSSRGSPTSPS